MSSSTTYKKLSNVNQVKAFFVAHGNFIGASNVDNHVQQMLSSFDEGELEPSLSHFHTITSGTPEDSLLAGCYNHDGWLYDLFFENAESLTTLQTSLQNKNMTHAIHLRNIPSSQRGIIVKSCQSLNYKIDSDIEMQLNLIDAAHIQSSLNVIQWQDNLDIIFNNLYLDLTNHPYPWDVFKQHFGGGQFCPELWMMDKENTSLIAINKPANPRTDDTIFNLFFAASKSNPDRLEQLLQHALQSMSQEAPTGLVHAHTNLTNRPIFAKLGFSDIDRTPLLTWKA